LLIAVDPLPITAGLDTIVIQGCAGDAEVDAAIDRALDMASTAATDEVERETTDEAAQGGAALDLVLSDMAPNISGIRAVDQARAMDLADVALQAARRWLRRGGAMTIKAFQGEGLDDWVTALREEFAKVTMTKPKASRHGWRRYSELVA